MKIIIITGPSCSGKTRLSQDLQKLFKDSFSIQTDSYYRDDMLIKIKSIFINDIYDRLKSIKTTAISKTISSIIQKDNSVILYKYDFRTRHSSRILKNIKHSHNRPFLIIEGIFSHRLDLNYSDTINIICEENKEICYQRRLIRDEKERGRNKMEVNSKFDKSWDLYYKELENYINNNKVIKVNTSNRKSLDKLINILKGYI
tara:strand:- start:488 stop:1093 length:606 start_codon:yes stop_codon:yes gene_type:complete